MPLIRLPIEGQPSWPLVEDFYAPDLVTGLILSYTQASIVGDVSTDADTWPSAIGGSPLTAATPGQRPAVVIDGFAQKMLSFAGTDRMTLAGIALPDAFTVAVKADFGATAGWPIQIESAQTRLAMYDVGSSSFGFYHTSSGTVSASASLSSAALVGQLWIVFRGTFGAYCDYRRGDVVTGRIACPARTSSEAQTLHLGARSTNASPKSGNYQQVHVWSRELHDRDVAALLLT